RPGMPYCASQWLWITGERECATGQPSNPAIPKSCGPAAIVNLLLCVRGDGPPRAANCAPSGGSERCSCLCRERGGRHFAGGSVAITCCLPLTTLVMKLSRSRSPLLSNETSSSTPGLSFTLNFAPCIAAANAFGSTLPSFSVSTFTKYIAL